MNENNFTIEKASMKDSKEILKLLNSSRNLLGYKGEKFTLAEVKDYIKQKVNLVVVSKLKDRIIGVFVANLWKDYCYLYLFVVEQEYRKEGAGNQMMIYLEKIAKEKGYIGLITKKEDIEMINLIKKRGYLKGDKFIYFHKDL